MIGVKHPLPDNGSSPKCARLHVRSGPETGEDYLKFQPNRIKQMTGRNFAVMSVEDSVLKRSEVFLCHLRLKMNIDRLVTVSLDFFGFDFVNSFKIM